MIRQNKAYMLWRSIREAIAGTDQDFTTGKLSRAIFLLSVPMVLEMVMESIFAVVDIFFVSRLGSDAVATVGITESMMTIIYSIAIGLSTATTAIISRRIGEKRPKDASVAAVQAVTVGFGVSILFSLVGVFFAKDLLGLMGASTEMINEGYMYPAIMLGSNSVIMLLFIMNAVFRSSGDAAISMRVLVFANIVNIILDPCFIFGIGPFPELGLKGAAVATSIGRGLAVVFQIYILLGGKKRIKVGKEHLKLDFGVMKRLVKISLGGIGQSLIATSSWIGMVRIIAVFGSQALAGYTIAIRIIIFALLPSWGISNAAATLVGQNLGAKKPDRAEKSVWVTGFINLILLGVMGTILVIFSRFFVGLFINEAEVIEKGALALTIISCGFVFYGFGMVIVQAFNGAGDTATPTKINFFCFWMIEIPLAYYLAIHTQAQDTGVYIAIVVAESILTIVGIIIFRRGKWKTRIV
ncbi:MATE family efflux transporter [Bacteroidota bacterium]